MNKRGNKKGLSTVVTTIIIIMLVLFAIAIIWVAINGFIRGGLNSVTLGNFGIDMVIESASIDYSVGIATLKVARNTGVSSEKVTAIHFIVEDSKNSEVFIEEVGDFKIFEKRTFYLNLTTSKILNLTDIWKISIAPVFLPSGGGTETIGPVTAGYRFGGNIQVNSTTDICTQNSDCGVDYWINGSEICSADKTQVLQYKKIFECFTGFCQSKTEASVVEVCLNSEFCYAGNCIPVGIPCTQENLSEACGISGFIGFPYCYSSPPPESIIQQYRNFTCQDGNCKESSAQQTVELCEGNFVCGISTGNPECYEPLECISNNDCELGELCESGICVPEEVAIIGNVSSIWPFNLGEYFDSPNLPKELGTINYVGYKIIFPGSNENRCLLITEFVYPNLTIHNSYVRLNESETNISNDNYFEIWQTEYGCTFI
ncbi:hypothetical protein COU58_03230 [Candidatus Pacearchaeota archaeon CG10_big_fil_rev_8_21_14_0_10_32_42]|nr:MAG: hypothetical protein CO037_00095 [Candidatus Pacearchaeota archaeon CG_4_9_14_0_2_um_filter_30_8]PJE81305.1 MAG: hypothetical protein COU58_03230 [Candidatus Pacearchaeota archaeon CG10_big_fil_rev_8_21_14_0_10_32_42]